MFQVKETFKNQRGMTLVEIMIVLAIIAGIMAVVLPKVTTAADKAKVREARIQISQVTNALSNYYTDCGKYPESLEGLIKQPSDCANWGPDSYVKEKMIKDPWGKPFAYVLNGSEYTIKSLGKDGAEGGSGFGADIASEDE